MNRRFPSDYSNIVEGNPHFFDAPPYGLSISESEKIQKEKTEEKRVPR